MTVAVTQAARLGARAVGCASTGTPPCVARGVRGLAGLPALVFVPGGVAMGN